MVAVDVLFGEVIDGDAQVRGSEWFEEAEVAELVDIHGSPVSVGISNHMGSPLHEVEADRIATRLRNATRRRGQIETERRRRERTEIGQTIQRGVEWQIQIDDARAKLKPIYPKNKR